MIRRPVLAAAGVLALVGALALAGSANGQTRWVTGFYQNVPLWSAETEFSAGV